MMCAINKKDIPFTVDHVGSFYAQNVLKPPEKIFLMVI